MNYEIDKQNFYSSKEKIDNLLNQIELFYKYVDKTALSVIIIDSKETEEYIVEKIKSFEKRFQIYDMLKLNLKELNSLFKSKSLCIINIKDFLKNNDIDRVKFYSGLNIIRDSVFLKENSRFIMLFDYEEYSIFKNIADDLNDYCHIFDFNTLFYNKDGLNIIDYNFEKNVKSYVKK